MVIIYQDSKNQVICTLTEKKITCTDTYLLEFINTVSNQTYYCVCTDTSTSKVRYQRLCVTHLFGDVDPLAGEVNFSLEGFYEYNIYENPDGKLIPTDLHLVETGRMKCVGEKQSKVKFIPTDNIRKVFDPKHYGQ